MLCGDDYVPFHLKERLIEAEELSRMVGSLVLPQIDNEERLWLNEDIGVATAALALEAVAVEAAKLGVIRQKMDIFKVLVADGVCYGVECSDGTILKAKTTIAATGPWTLALLDNSKIQLPSDFFKITAISVATLSLSPDEYTTFKSMPIVWSSEGMLYSMVVFQCLRQSRRNNPSLCSENINTDYQHRCLLNQSP